MRRSTDEPCAARTGTRRGYTMLPPHARDRPLPDLQGLRRPRHLRRGHRRRHRRGGRPRPGPRARRPLRQADERAARSASGATCACPRPSSPARYRDGLVAEGAHVVDAGMVGTEMLYWLVGSRDLDGGLMCTASHNPKAYTGAKMVERGSVALSGDRGLNEVRAHIENGLGEAPGGGSYEEVDIYAEFQREALKVIDAERDPAAEGRARRRQRDGRPDGRPDPRSSCRLELIRPTGSPTASSPTTSRTRCCPRTASSSSARCSRPAPTSASPGTATPTAASSSTARASSSPATSSPRCWPPVVLEKVPGADILYDVRASRAVAGHGRPGSAAARWSTASATRSSRPACATRAASSAARSPATTTSRPSTTRTPARSPRC